MIIPLFALLLGATPAAECNNMPSRGTNISINNDSHDERSVFSYLRSTADRCESATIVGVLTYTTEEDDVAAMSFGSSAVFRERTGSADRALSLSTDADGRIIRAYRVN